MSNNFQFESLGIGELLRRNRLRVPPNQRPYAWGEEHVRTLLEDFNQAISDDDDDYFLGTVVLVDSGDDWLDIADGQQRLATTSILLARIRDKQLELGRAARAEAIDREYLHSLDLETEEQVPRIQLNSEDHEFFSNYILNPDGNHAYHMKVPMTKPSNVRLFVASRVISDFVETLVGPFKIEAQSDYLLRWLSFIRLKATVVAVTARDEVGAFRMFETLNDRGVQASQADILKNYLFMQTSSRNHEAQVLWHSIVSAIEALPDDVDQRLITFLRHFWILTHGPTKERELAAYLRNEVTTERKALNFLNAASEAVQDYVALWSSQHPTWMRHRPSTRQSIETIAQHLRVEQIRPLLFAIVRHFDPIEAEKALRLCVSWSVRFLIFGGRGGLLDQQYSLRAAEIGTGRITKARELRDTMERYVPNDAEFETAFSTARVSRPRFARYYLRALEKTMRGERHPEFVANEDITHVNLDHVLPLTPDDSWNISDEEAEVAQKLLGNMVLMRAQDNTAIGNRNFTEKRARYAASAFLTTKMVAQELEWGVEQIKHRQGRLAQLASETWPLTFD